MKNLFKRLFALTENGAKGLINASLASFSVYLMSMLPVILLMYLLDTFVGVGGYDKVWLTVGSIAVLVGIYVALNIEYDLLYNATYQESANLRIEIANILNKLPLSYFSKHDLSDLSQTVMADIASIEHAMSHAMGKTIGFIMFFPVVAVMLLMGQVKLGLAVIIPILVGVLFFVLSKHIQIANYTKHYHQLRANSESFQETIEMQQEIKSYGLKSATKSKLYQQMETSERIQLKSELVIVLPLLLAGMIFQLSFVIVMIVGMNMYITGEISLLYLVGYVLASIKLKEMLDGIDQNMSELYYLDTRIKRIKEIKETKTQEGERQNLHDFDITFEHVTFSYQQGENILKNISFKAKQNQVTALVGVSGCGKTSILRLISRLYDYDKGEIRIGGVDIKKIATESLYQNISIVFQDVSLFNTSVMENIRLGKANATDEEVIKASKLANCDAFIRALPDGYNTHIGENGSTLSGGERQRLSIARAFLKDAPIIILDEISSALDVDNESKIQESLLQLIKNKTVVIISHRLKSIENVDHIVVLDDGKIEATGNHYELLKTSSTYQKLIKNAKLAETYRY